MYEWFESLMDIPPQYANSNVTYCAVVACLVCFVVVVCLFVRLISTAFGGRK